MNLRVSTPTTVIVDREVTSVQAEDATGRFGVRTGHEPLLTALVECILIYRYREDGQEREAYIAVRQGVLRVSPEGVDVASREAHASDDISALTGRIRSTRRHWRHTAYRSARSMYQMQLAAWRRIMEYEDVRTRQ
jgi:F-type H+-transporting ATPase subunit epsilon